MTVLLIKKLQMLLTEATQLQYDWNKVAYSVENCRNVIYTEILQCI